jgi:hypothetical protein
MVMLFLDAGHNYRKYGAALTTHDVFKFFAITLMVVDHVGYIFFPEELWWRVAGRLCVPIWIFFAGYARPNKFHDELIPLGAMLVLTDWWVGEHILPLNIFATIIVCRMFVDYAETLTHDAMALATLLTISLILLPLTVFLFEYGSQVFPQAIAGFYARYYRGHWLAAVSLGLAWLIFCTMQTLSFEFSPLQTGSVFAGCAVVCLTLHRYELKTLPQTEGHLLAKPVAFIARNSHYVYTLHLIAFLLLRECMRHPATGIPT